MRATVITDASYCSQTSSAGWAACVRIDGVKDPIKRYGSFKTPVANSFEAEALAAINGVWIASKFGATEVLLQTDCLAVVNLANGSLKKGKSLSFWRYGLFSAGLLKFEFTAKHVKGHSSVNDARSYVNRWCDKNAKKSMRSARGLH